jgi:hypothetical protein
MRRWLFTGLVAGLLVAGLGAQDRKPKDSPKAAATRKLLDKKVDADFAEDSLKEILENLKEQVKGLNYRFDPTAGVSGNMTITYKGQKQALRDVLAGILKKHALGYYIDSREGTAYDGLLTITKGNQRGYPAGQEPDKSAAKRKDKSAGDKTASKDKGKRIEKADDRAKAGEGDKPPDDEQKAEQDAGRKFRLAKMLADDGKTAKAKERLEDIVAKYPKTKAAEYARELLKTLDK